MNTGKRISELPSSLQIGDEDYVPFVDVTITNATKKITFGDFKQSLNCIQAPINPQQGYVLTYSSGAWVAAAPTGGGTGSSTLAGEVTGLSSATKVSKLFNVSLNPAITTAQEGNIIYCSGNKWVNGPISEIPTSFAYFTPNGNIDTSTLDKSDAINYTLTTSNPDRDSLKIWAYQLAIPTSVTVNSITIKCDGETNITPLPLKGPSFKKLFCVLANSDKTTALYTSFTNETIPTITITPVTAAASLKGLKINLLILGFRDPSS